jgi:hypothetical protein
MIINVQDDIVAAKLRAMPSVIAKASVRAMNRSIGKTKTSMSRSIGSDLRIKIADVKKALKLKNATLSSPFAMFSSSVVRIPLMAFSAKGPEPTKGKGRGVSYRLQGGRGRVPNAFIARMRSGHRGVFVRAKDAAGGKRSKRAWSDNLPIIELFGPSIGHIFKKYREAEAILLPAIFDKNFQHELQRAENNATITVSGDV